MNYIIHFENCEKFEYKFDNTILVGQIIIYRGFFSGNYGRSIVNRVEHDIYGNVTHLYVSKLG